MTFTAAQTAQLLKPIAQQRVLTDGKGHSHVSQQDVTAHLIRMFGFGNFDTEVLAVECVFETPRTDPKTEKPTGRYDVCYRALLRLTIKDPDGKVIAQYEDGSTATAQNQTRGDGHDLAYKSAISLAKKRCAINLGDQFGLSLYNKGQTNALVIDTLVRPDRGQNEDAGPDDIQADVPQQVALGNDETDYEPAEPAATAEVGTAKFTELSDLISGSSTKVELAAVAQQIAASPVSGEGREQLRLMYSARVKALAS